MKNGGAIIVYILPQWCKLIKLCKSKWYVVNLELLGPPLGICLLFPVCNSQPCPTGMAVGWCTTDHWRITSPRALKFSSMKCILSRHVTANNDRLRGQKLIMFMIIGLLGLKVLQGDRSSDTELTTEEKNTSIIIKARNREFICPLY